MHTLFLINPKSGRKTHKKADSIEAYIDQVYKEAGLPVSTVPIDFERLDTILEEAIANGVQNIFAVGGDGTVNAIGTRLVNKPVNFGVIPTGSGNGYARHLGFSINTQLAVRQSVTAESMAVDTGVFGDVPFLNVAGVGLDAVVAESYAENKRRGLGPYVQKTAKEYLRYKAQDYTLRIDDLTLELHDILAIAISNGTQWGYDARIAPLSRLTDGSFEVVIVKKFPFIKVGRMISMLFNGKLEQSQYVEVISGKRFEITRHDAGTAQVDGEPLKLPAYIKARVRPSSLNLLLPNTLTNAKKIEL